MKYIILLLIFFQLVGCKKEDKTLNFEHIGISLHYPSNWNRVENDHTIFGITNNSLFDGDGSNILLQKIDSVESSYYGTNSFDEYVNSLFEFQKTNNKLLISKKLEDVYLNKIPCKKFIAQKEGIFSTMIQTTFLFNYNKSYYNLILTEVIDLEDESLNRNRTILSSLELKNIESNTLL
ncbi:hypothetical protein [Flammeovirga sp. SubArs3]|uniref:hypothetical protein n=1 Tax=Flammeovirga sp. SubArs3 TaxID=2995316 RepID=UPI00248D361D|nr:hypothetical protein [Flammeovirga sp. SubArs3]